MLNGVRQWQWQRRRVAASRLEAVARHRAGRQRRDEEQLKYRRLAKVREMTIENTKGNARPERHVTLRQRQFVVNRSVKSRSTQNNKVGEKWVEVA